MVLASVFHSLVYAWFTPNLKSERTSSAFGNLCKTDSLPYLNSTHANPNPLPRYESTSSLIRTLHWYLQMNSRSISASKFHHCKHKSTKFYQAELFSSILFVQIRYLLLIHKIKLNQIKWCSKCGVTT